MNRNIVTERDAQSARQSAALEAPSSQTSPDTWYQKLMKYIPGEAIGLYLVLDGIFKSAMGSPSPPSPEVPAAAATTPALVVSQPLADPADSTHIELQFWLGASLAVALVFNWLYLRKFWKVTRPSQLAISSYALTVYVFAMGGVFATFAWYKPWQGTALLAVTAAFLAFVDPPEAPPANPPAG